MCGGAPQGALRGPRPRWSIRVSGSRLQSTKLALGIMTTAPPLSFTLLNGGWLPGSAGAEKLLLFTASFARPGHILFTARGLKTLSRTAQCSDRTWKVHACYTEFTACRHEGGAPLGSRERPSRCVRRAEICDPWSKSSPTIKDCLVSFVLRYTGQLPWS